MQTLANPQNQLFTNTQYFPNPLKLVSTYIYESTVKECLLKCLLTSNFHLYTLFKGRDSFSKCKISKSWKFRYNVQ